MSKDVAREKIQRLIDSYDAVVRDGRKAEFSEADVGSKFILPLLSALGWEVTKIEDVKEQRRTLVGIADYSLLNVRGTAKIFLELKKFEEDLDNSRRVGGSIKSYPQMAIDYAWQSRADWAILTNFEEIRLYYSHVKKPKEGLIFKLRYNDYLMHFDKLWLLSKESIVSGLLDTYEKRRLRRDVDEALLKDLVYCRKLLVANVQKNNPQLSKEEINESTQKILDRLMFIRSCEDRLIISAESLWTQFSVRQKTVIDKSVWKFMMDLKNIFREFDVVYNGQLFAPHPCEDLLIDNNILEAVLVILYNYNFDLIPVDVLGNAYELYIGTIIKEKEGALKEDELILVEEPSVRKKHGIYYTPEYVVDYIVRSTLGELLKNCKTVDEVSKIKVLDPACGSGSFLIKAFDAIKEWYDGYNKQNQRGATPNTLDAHFHTISNVEEKILIDNLYGVDLDPQAVEVTILNLSLKAVKTRKKLPYMGDHIKCGNSLIFGSTDKMLEYFGEKWQEKRPFTWEDEFPEVFNEGGFDVILGNPPYYSMETRPEEEQNYFQNTSPNLYRGKNDVYYYFIARGLDLLKDRGTLGFIVERYWLEATFGDKLRQLILDNAAVREIIDFGKLKIFRDSGNHTCIVVFCKNLNQNDRRANIIKVARISDWGKSHKELLNYVESHLNHKEFENASIRVFELCQGTLTSEQWVLATAKSQDILEKLKKNSSMLSDLCDIEQGQKSGLNEAFSVTKAQIREHSLETQLLRKMIKNSEIGRYQINWKGRYLIYTTDETNIDDYPNVRKYLERFYDRLIRRAEVEDGLYPWFRLQRPRRQRLWDASEKIVVPFRAPENRFAYDNQQFFNDGGDVRVIVPRPDCNASVKYILSCLNSKVLNFFFWFIGRPKGQILEFFVEPLSKLPIHRIDFSNALERKRHDELVSLVDEMLSLNRRLMETTIEFDRYLTEPVMGYVNFKDYYNKLDIKDKEALDKTSKGTVKRVSVEEHDSWLTFKVEYITKQKETTEEFANIPVLKCRFEDPYFRKYVFHTFKNYKKKWGSGNLLAAILGTPIPCFDKNPAKNNEIIQKIMRQYLKAVEQKQQLEKEIRETDNTMDSKVYQLYELTPEEITTIENSLKQ